MKKKDFIKYLNDIFKSHGFIKNGNNWFLENDYLKKVINIQKSRFGNNYYLNYGYILKKLELQKLAMHIYHRLSSLNGKENQRIIELLDFEKNIPDEQRKKELKPYIEGEMLKELENINSETDIINELKKRPHLNDVPLLVKRYFHLE